MGLTKIQGMVTMSKTLLVMIILSFLVGTILFGCEQQPASVETPTPTPTPTPSVPPSTQLTMLSITEGDVLIMKSGTNSWLEAQVGMTLESGDTIKAGDDSRAVITFFEGSTIELEAGTEISVTELSTAIDTGSTTISLKQEIGKTISRVEKLADTVSRYEVETPGAVAVARGTIMHVYVDLLGGAIIGCEAGNVTGSAQGVTVHIPPGTQRYAKKGQSFGDAVPIGSPPPDGGEDGGDEYPNVDGGGGGGGGQSRRAAIAIAKVANCTEAHEGDEISYTYNVTNTGNTPLSNVSVSDDRAGNATYQSGDTNVDNELDVNETWIFTANYTVTDGDTDPLVNEATASGTYGGRVVTDWASASVDILRSAIAIAKAANCTEANEGDAIAYTYNVTNSGDTPLSNVSVSDDKAGDAGYQSGDTNGDNKLDVGESWMFTATYTVTDEDIDPLVNVATASGADALGKTVSAQASANVTILRLAIAIAKAANCTEANEGDAIAYTYNVTNSGDTPLSNVSVSDDKAGDAGYQSGDTNGDNKLDVGESWMFTATYTVTDEDIDPLVNVATASGADALGKTVSAQASANVTILRPAIAIAKAANCTEANEGDAITYTYNVTNNGDTPLSNVSVGDDKAGDAGYQRGDTNGDNKLDVGENWVFTATYTVTDEDIDPLVNVATASGTDALGKTVSAQASASVSILIYGIRIELTWDAETDLDSHFIRPGGEMLDIFDDCHWRNKNPDWGLLGVVEDNPLLSGDDTDGYGPENIYLRRPYEGGIYQYKVYCFDDYGYGSSTATVKIWINGIKVAEYIRGVSYDEVWDCVSIEWPSGDVAPASGGESCSPPELGK